NRAQDVRDAGDVTRDILFDELAAAAGLGEHRRDAVQGCDGHKRPRPLTGWGTLHGPARAVRVRHRLNALVECRVLRLPIDDERDEVFNEVPGVEIDRVVALGDDLREEMVREPLTPRSVRLAR